MQIVIFILYYYEHLCLCLVVINHYDYESINLFLCGCYPLLCFNTTFHCTGVDSRSITWRVTTLQQSQSQCGKSNR